MLAEQELSEKLKKKLEEHDFDKKFDEFLKNYFNNYDIYKHIYGVEEFVSFSGRLCTDTSGDVEAFHSKEDLISFIKNEYEPCEFCPDHILNNLYNGQREASYCSGCGWHFVSIQDELDRYFDEIKYDLYNYFVMENKEKILKTFNLSYKSDEEFNNNIFDDLDSTSLSDYIVFESSEIVQNYLDSITEDDIIKMIK